MRAIILAAMLICFTLMVPLTVSVIERFLQSPSGPRFELGFNSCYKIRDTLVSLSEEPGSGGGGGGVI